MGGDRGRARGKGREKLPSRLHTEHEADLNSMTLTSGPEPEQNQTLSRQSPPGPRDAFLIQVSFLCLTITFHNVEYTEIL